VFAIIQKLPAGGINLSVIIFQDIYSPKGSVQFGTKLIKYVDLLIKHIDLSSSETLNYLNGWRLVDTNKGIDKKNVSKEVF